MGKSTRVRLSDIRHVYRIINEIVELGDDPDAWRAHLVEELLHFFHFQYSVSFVVPLPMDTSNLSAVKACERGLDEAGLRIWSEYGCRGDLSSDPCTPAIASRAGRPFTAVRPMLVDDHQWYQSPFYNEHRHQTRSDDLLISMLPMPQIGILHTISGDRARGSPPMGRREVVCCSLIHQELARKWQRMLAHTTQIEKRLPRRLAELLGHLRGPDSEKQIALKMGLSPHTIHNHVRRLYAKFDVASRAELMMVESKQRPLGVPRLGVAGL
jgi:DNA-binding CsgD family transcriptional regulator